MGSRLVAGIASLILFLVLCHVVPHVGNIGRNGAIHSVPVRYHSEVVLLSNPKSSDFILEIDEDLSLSEDPSAKSYKLAGNCSGFDIHPQSGSIRITNLDLLDPGLCHFLVYSTFLEGHQERITDDVIILVKQDARSVSHFSSRQKRADKNEPLTFFVRKTDTGELFSVASNPPDPNLRYTFAEPAPVGLEIDGESGEVSRATNFDWDHGNITEQSFVVLINQTDNDLGKYIPVVQPMQSLKFSVLPLRVVNVQFTILELFVRAATASHSIRRNVPVLMVEKNLPQIKAADNTVICMYLSRGISECLYW